MTVRLRFSRASSENHLGRGVYCVPYQPGVQHSTASLLRAFGVPVAHDGGIETHLVVRNARNAFRDLSIREQRHVWKGVFLDWQALIRIQANTTLSMKVTMLRISISAFLPRKGTSTCLRRGRDW